jgi:hypothetical protein
MNKLIALAVSALFASSVALAQMPMPRPKPKPLTPSQKLEMNKPISAAPMPIGQIGPSRAAKFQDKMQKTINDAGAAKPAAKPAPKKPASDAKAAPKKPMPFGPKKADAAKPK